MWSSWWIDVAVTWRATSDARCKISRWCRHCRWRTRCSICTSACYSNTRRCTIAIRILAKGIRQQRAKCFDECASCSCCYCIVLTYVAQQSRIAVIGCTTSYKRWRRWRCAWRCAWSYSEWSTPYSCILTLFLKR